MTHGDNIHEKKDYLGPIDECKCKKMGWVATLQCTHSHGANFIPSFSLASLSDTIYLKFSYILHCLVLYVMVVITMGALTEIDIRYCFTSQLVPLPEVLTSSQGKYADLVLTIRWSESVLSQELNGLPKQPLISGRWRW